jgi:GcrA cell cycle regulator
MAGKRVRTMETTDWPPEHSAALREYFAKGMSFAQIARALNARFNTAYSRNAALGRGKRMELAGPARPEAPPHVPRPVKHDFGAAEVRPSGFQGSTPASEKVPPVKLRCVEIEPRHLALTELEVGDCRYPYGGDDEGEPITFCGHQRRPGSSYCAPHFHLSRDPIVKLERPAGAVSLKVVERA